MWQRKKLKINQQLKGYSLLSAANLRSTWIVWHFDSIKYFVAILRNTWAVRLCCEGYLKLEFSWRDGQNAFTSQGEQLWCLDSKEDTGLSAIVRTGSCLNLLACKSIIASMSPAGHLYTRGAPACMQCHRLSAKKCSVVCLRIVTPLTPHVVDSQLRSNRQAFRAPDSTGYVPIKYLLWTFTKTCATVTCKY